MGKRAECEALRTPEMLALIEECRKKGYTHQEIADIVHEKTGRVTSRYTIGRLLGEYVNTQEKLLQRDEELKEKIRVDAINISVQLKAINKKLWEALEKIKVGDPKQITSLTRLSDAILKQLEFEAKRLGKFKPTKEELSPIEFSMKIKEHLTKLEESGYIKFLKRPSLLIKKPKKEIAEAA